MAINAGWYRDKVNPSFARYWDGRQWTEHTRPIPQPPTYPPTLPAATAAPMAAPTVEKPKTAAAENVNEGGLRRSDVVYIALGGVLGAIIGAPIAYFVFQLASGNL